MSINTNKAHPINRVDPQQVWQDSLREGVNRTWPVGNGTVRVNSRPTGTNLSINPDQLRRPIVNYRTYDVYSYGAQTSTLISNHGGYDCAFFNPSSAYNPGDIVRVYEDYSAGTFYGEPVTITKGTYICVAYVPPEYSSEQIAALEAVNCPSQSYRKSTTCYAPVVPEPYINAIYFGGGGSTMLDAQGRYWEQIGTSGASGSVDQYQIEFIRPDYYVATDGTTIAKNTKIRGTIATENLYGININYTYANSQSVQRTAVGTGISELHVIVPPILINDYIYAMPFETGLTASAADSGITGSASASMSGSAITYIDMNIDARAWAYRDPNL